MTLVLRNRQRVREVDLRLLRKISLCLVKEILREPQFELGIHLVNADEMASINETFLQHSGSTDVVTFDYAGENSERKIHGEIFISIHDAVKHAKEFKTTWQSELVRYIVHGILHLKGFDDLDSASRKKMKVQENRLVKELSEKFSLAKLHKKSAAK